MKKYNKGFIDLLVVGALAIALAITSVVAYVTVKNKPAPVETQSFGSTFNPTGGGTYRLQSSISSTQSSITLTSFKEPISGIKYTMSYLNSSIEYATIDPQNNNSKEFVSFTGITQNSDGTALLTGVSRGLGFSYPYTASTTLASSHSGQSIFILSNPPQLTNQYLNTANGGTVTGYTVFTDPPAFTNAATTTNQAASIAYVNGIAFGGTTVTVPGGGTGQATLPLNTLLIGNGASAITGTSSPTVGYITATSSTPSLFVGGITSLGGTFTASTTINATTTIAASSATNNALVLNNVAYKFPSTRGASSTVLMENGSGSLTWNAIATPRYTTSATTDITVSGANSNSTSTVFSLPAGIMTASSTIEATLQTNVVAGGGGSGSCTFELRDNTTGTAYSSFSESPATSNGYEAVIRIIILNNNSVSAQKTNAYGVASVNSGSGVSLAINSENTSSFNLANAFSLAFNVQSSSANSSDCRIRDYSIIVNP